MRYALPALFATALLAAGASAAPDEEALGKSEGYPICPPSLRPEQSLRSEPVSPTPRRTSP